MDEATFTDRSQRLLTDRDYLLMDRRCYSMIANFFQQIGAVTDLSFAIREGKKPKEH